MTEDKAANEVPQADLDDEALRKWRAVSARMIEREGPYRRLRVGDLARFWGHGRRGV